MAAANAAAQPGPLQRMITRPRRGLIGATDGDPRRIRRRLTMPCMCCGLAIELYRFHACQNKLIDVFCSEFDLQLHDAMMTQARMPLSTC